MNTSKARWTMAAVILGSGIVFLDSTIIGVASPRIAEELKSTLFSALEGQSYIYNGYLLTLSALLILAGAVNDYFGRRKMFVFGLIGFGVTSVMCGLAPNMEMLVAFRLLQGAAGALLVPGSLAIINATFSGEEEGRAYGIWAGASAATTILGPFAGGLLVDSISWRAAFLMNAPLVLLGVYATLRHVDESRDENAAGHFDWVGAVLIVLGTGGLAFGAIRGQQVEWEGVLPFVAIAVGALATVAFPFVMARSRHPLVPLELFRSRNFTVTNISTFVIYGALYVTFYFLTIYLQGTLGYSAAAAGLVGIPVSLFITFGSSKMGTLAARHGPRIFMTIGPLLMGLGLLWLAALPSSSEPWIFGSDPPARLLPPTDYYADLLPGLVVFGIGLMIMVAPLTTALMTSIPKQKSGVGSAINNAISRIGPQLAGALIFVAIASSFYAGIQDRVPDAPVSSSEFRKDVAPLNQPKGETSEELARAIQESSGDSFRLTMWLSAGLLFAGAAINAVGISNRQAKAVEPGPIATPADSAPAV